MPATAAIPVGVEGFRRKAERKLDVAAAFILFVVDMISQALENEIEEIARVFKVGVEDEYGIW